MTEFIDGLESAVQTAKYVGDDDVMLISSALVIECAELIKQQAAQIEALRNKLKQIAETDWLPERVRGLIKEALTGK